MIGTKLSHFRILAKLGEGGMGVVYRAEDERLRREVALKVLPPEVVANEERRLRFLREARAAATVIHPNIATIFHADEAEGVVFIAMELVEGKTLRSIISGRPLPLKDALRIATEVVEGLARAHQGHVIHRDLKPDNIMVSPDGHAKILDFGLAKLLEERAEARGSEMSRLATISGEITREGKIFGTVAYMSPEQARGQPVDGRSDLFSFGTTLYEMATGRVPFQGKTSTDVLSAIIRDNPDPASRRNAEVPPELERIIGKCLEKDPDDRYQDTRDLAVDLRKLRRLTDSGVQVVPGAPVPATRRGRTLAIGAALAGCVMLGGLVWFTTHRSERIRGLTLRQLTANPVGSAVQDAAISPDGKYLAFADRDGLHLLLIETGEGHLIPLAGDFHLGEVTWFPDSARLVAAGQRGTEGRSGLWIFPVMGGSPRSLRNDSWGVAVSPDGSRVAFLAGTWPSREIWLMGSNGEDAKKTVQGGEADAFFWVIWSPDGKRIAYGRTNSAPGGSPAAIESRDPDDSSSAAVLVADRRLFQDWHGMLRAGWSADGRLIFALTEPPPRESDSNLWEVRVDSRTGRVASDPRKITEWIDHSVQRISLSADGRRAAFLKSRSQPDIFLGKLAEGGNRLEAVQRLTSDERSDYPSAWAPDSRAVLYQSNRRGNWDIFKQEVGSPSPEPLVTSPARESGAVFAPGGNSILFWSSPVGAGASNSRSVMRIAAIGGAPEAVLSAGETAEFHCPTAARRPCLLSEIVGRDLVFSAFDPVEGKPARVASTEINSSRFINWDLSPDGTKVAITNFDSHVRILDLSGSKPRDLEVKGWALLETLAWSADGNSVYVDGRPESVGTKGIFRLGLDGTVHPLPCTTEWCMMPTPSPDGHYLAYASMIFERNAWMVEGF